MKYIGTAKVYLVQHGEAKPAEEDPSRPLTPRGEEEVKQIANFLRRINVRVKKIFHSGKLRAFQTASILAEAVEAEIEQVEGLEPGADPGIWYGRLNMVEEDQMLVGHLPHLSRLASLLLTGDPKKEVIKFRYGAVICLEKYEDGWAILWMIRPDLLK